MIVSSSSTDVASVVDTLSAADETGLPGWDPPVELDGDAIAFANVVATLKIDSSSFTTGSRLTRFGVLEGVGVRSSSSLFRFSGVWETSAEGVVSAGDSGFLNLESDRGVFFGT